MLKIQGDIQYKYHDIFTDPASLRQIFRGNSDPFNATIAELVATDIEGSFFDIIGKWQTNFAAEVKINPKASVY